MFDPYLALRTLRLPPGLCITINQTRCIALLGWNCQITNTSWPIIDDRPISLRFLSTFSRTADREWICTWVSRKVHKLGRTNCKWVSRTKRVVKIKTKILPFSIFKIKIQARPMVWNWYSLCVPLWTIYRQWRCKIAKALLQCNNKSELWQILFQNLHLEGQCSHTNLNYYLTSLFLLMHGSVFIMWKYFCDWVVRFIYETPWFTVTMWNLCSQISRVITKEERGYL